jgi:RNA polymerase sigma-70 factor, ECF subfamily
MDTGSRGHTVTNQAFAELLILAQQGSPDALGKVLESCRRVLTRAAARHIPRDLLARFSPSDVVQETFLEAQKDFRQFSGSSPDELMAWLSQLLRNNCSNLVRSYRHTGKRRSSLEVHLDDDSVCGRLREGLEAPSPGPSERAIAQEEWAQLTPALQALPEDKLMALRLRFVDKLSFKEIGLRLGCSAEAARKSVSRTMQQVRAGCENPDTGSFMRGALPGSTH